ncbi:MAG: aminodeoxychorismate synthase component I [Flavobacteriales bacterium]|nr:aminodeoxychorismate synthase component I [Flavobacteriales bacterium]
MTQKIIKYKITDPALFKLQVIEYVRRFDTFCFLDSNDCKKKDNSFDYLIAFSKINETNNSNDPIHELDHFLNANKNWAFGYLSYDLKNYIENLDSQNYDNHAFPVIHFFIPQIILKIKEFELSIITSLSDSKSFFDELLTEIQSHKLKIKNTFKVNLKSRVDKATYIKNIHKIKRHLKRGDIYEMNYCQEFYADSILIDPFSLFFNLNCLSKAPFSSFYRVKNNYILCASPERFLKRTGNTIISQPIKGTIKREQDHLVDEENKNKLLNSSKDIAENVMIVDLVRNDLSRFAQKNTVIVNELSKLYTYKDVHHLISTISCKIPQNMSVVDIIKSTFPMGSMTGAPKIRSMELIEHFESTLRGAYSGSIGYISPEKEFDFNVIIRSLFYNQQSKYLSCMVGGAITLDSDPESEYQECLIKAKSIFKVLGQ